MEALFDAMIEKNNANTPANIPAFKSRSDANEISMGDGLMSKARSVTVKYLKPIKTDRSPQLIFPNTDHRRFKSEERELYKEHPNFKAAV